MRRLVENVISAITNIREKGFRIRKQRELRSPRRFLSASMAAFRSLCGFPGRRSAICRKYYGMYIGPRASRFHTMRLRRSPHFRTVPPPHPTPINTEVILGSTNTNFGGRLSVSGDTESAASGVGSGYDSAVDEAAARAAGCRHRRSFFF